MTNPASTPEAYDLTIIDAIDRPDFSYEFEMFMVWRHEDGRLFWADDSGCSCSAPFEGYRNLSGLQTGDAVACGRAVDAWVESSYASDRAKVKMRQNAIALKWKLRALR